MSEMLSPEQAKTSLENMGFTFSKIANKDFEKAKVEEGSNFTCTVDQMKKYLLPFLKEAKILPCTPNKTIENQLLKNKHHPLFHIERSSIRPRNSDSWYPHADDYDVLSFYSDVGSYGPHHTIIAPIRVWASELLKIVDDSKDIMEKNKVYKEAIYSLQTIASPEKEFFPADTTNNIKSAIEIYNHYKLNGDSDKYLLDLLKKKVENSPYAWTQKHIKGEVNLVFINDHSQRNNDHIVHAIYPQENASPDNSNGYLLVGFTPKYSEISRIIS